MFVFSWRSWLLFPEIQLVISIWPKTSFGYKNQCHRNKEGLTVWPCLYCHLHQAPQTHTKNECHNFQSRNTLLEIRWKLQTPTKPKKSFKTFCAWSGNSLEELKSGNLKFLDLGFQASMMCLLWSSPNTPFMRSTGRSKVVPNKIPEAKYCKVIFVLCLSYLTAIPQHTCHNMNNKTTSSNQVISSRAC